MNEPEKSSAKHKLEKLIAILEQIAHGTEDDFLAIGSRLHAIHSEASNLHDRIQSGIRSMAADGESGLLRSVQDYVGHSEERTAQSLESVEQLEERLSSIAGLLKQISSLGYELRQAGVFLRALGINTGIESSRTNRIGMMFSLVAKDSVALAGIISELTVQLLDQAEAAKIVQEKTLVRARANLKELKTFSLQADEIAQKAMNGINGLFTQMAAVTGEAVQLSRNITQDIGTVVMGIQFHDDFRQRLEHISQAITNVLSHQEKAATPEDDRENQPANTPEDFMVVELQRLQLEALHQEVGEVFQTQSQSFATIAESIVQLTRILGGVTKGNAAASGDKDVFVNLSQAMTSLSTAKTASENLCNAISQSAAEAMQVTTRLAGFVRETALIASQVQRNALNSIIKAAKLGNIGRPLQVLSQSMAAVAIQVKELAPLFMERMEQVRELVQFGDDRAEDQEGNTLQAFDIQTILNAFQEFRDNTVAIIAEGELLVESVTGESRHFLFFHDLELKLATQVDGLVELAALLRPSGEDLAGALTADIFNNLAERYTSDKERAVHQKFFLANGQEISFRQEPPEDMILFDLDEIPTGQETQAAGGENEDFGVNVELF